jgi:phage-related protein (TIGR01555 family)
METRKGTRIRAGMTTGHHPTTLDGGSGLMVTPATRTLDAFANLLARTGYGSGSLLEATTYPLTRLTRQYLTINSLYRSHWIVRKIIDAKPQDMLKGWARPKGSISPEDIASYFRVVKRTNTPAMTLEGLQWGRLYGGAASLMIIKGEGGRLEKPLDLGKIGLDSYRGLLNFDRWSGVVPSTEMGDDIDDPMTFGKPLYYTLTPPTGTSGGVIKVHASRLLRWYGRSLPNWERQSEMGWGMSEIEPVFEELKKRDNSSWNIANLIFRANIIALKTADGGSLLATQTAQTNQRVDNMLQAQNHLMSNQGLLLVGKDEGIESSSYSFSGLSDVYINFMLDICGASGYTMAKLFGRSASGLGQTGEGDSDMYHEDVEQGRMRELDPNMTHLNRVIAASTWGQIPDDLDQQYPSARSTTPKERAELFKDVSGGLSQLYGDGLIGRKTVLIALKKSSDDTGILDNIDDETIEAADDDVVAPGVDTAEPGAEPGKMETENRVEGADKEDGK